MQKVANMGTMYQKLMQYMQIAFQFAMQLDPNAAQGIAQDFAEVTGSSLIPAGMQSAPVQIAETSNISGLPKEEHAFVERARQNANEASQPDSGGAINTKR